MRAAEKQRNKLMARPLPKKKRKLDFFLKL